jgi:hypothetical protein
MTRYKPAYSADGLLNPWTVEDSARYLVRRYIRQQPAYRMASGLAPQKPRLAREQADLAAARIMRTWTPRWLGIAEGWIEVDEL